MKKIFEFFLATAAVLAVTGCVYYADQSSANNGTGGGSARITSLQAVIDDANIGSTINLSQYPDITEYNAMIDKKNMTVSGNSTDMKSAALTVSADGVSIRGIRSASVTASSGLGNGTLKISSSSLSSLTINGGGINSIVISDVTVDNVTINKEKSNDNTSDQYVRLCIDGAANITNLNINSSALIDLSSDSSTDKFDLSAVSIKFTGDNSNDINVAVRKTITVGDASADQVKAEFSMGGSAADGFYIIANKGAKIKKDFYQQVSNKIADREIDAEIIPPVVGDSTFDFNVPIAKDTSLTVNVPDKPDDPESGSGDNSSDPTTTTTIPTTHEHTWIAEDGIKKCSACNCVFSGPVLKNAADFNSALSELGVVTSINDDEDNSNVSKIIFGLKSDEKITAKIEGVTDKADVGETEGTCYAYKGTDGENLIIYIVPEDENATGFEFNGYCTEMFEGHKKCTEIAGLGFVDTSKVTAMNGMFRKCEALTSLNVSNFNTSNVTNISWMFWDCKALTSLDVSKFDTSNVTDMSMMFWGCEALTSLDVSKFDTSNVTDMSMMFQDCNALPSLDLSKFDTSKVTKMNGMFYGCKAMTSIDMCSFNTSNVTTMSWMFAWCDALKSINLSSFNTSNVTDMKQMFSYCFALTSLDVSKFDTSNVTDMSNMFDSCNALSSLDISSFDTSNVTNMSSMFFGCNALTSLDLSNFDTSKVTDMSGMFDFCNVLTTLDISSFDTSNVTNMSAMFCNCQALATLDISKFDTSNVTDMSRMFSSCTTLATIYVADANAFIPDAVKSTDAVNAENDNYMFMCCGIEAFTTKPE